MDIMDLMGNNKENLSCYQMHRIVELFPDMGVLTSSAKAPGERCFFVSLG